MAKSKAEGGLGLRDLRLLDAATMIKKLYHGGLGVG